jgi:hypothetical protein
MRKAAQRAHPGPAAWETHASTILSIAVECLPPATALHEVGVGVCYTRGERQAAREWERAVCMQQPTHQSNTWRNLKHGAPAGTSTLSVQSV